MSGRKIYQGVITFTSKRTWDSDAVSASEAKRDLLERAKSFFANYDPKAKITVTQVKERK